MSERSIALDRFVLTLADKPLPRVCFLPTASGDPREQVTRFYERFAGWACEPSILSLFHLGRDRIDPIAHLLGQDVIYVGGGSMRNMLAIWREHGIDRALARAWRRGVVLAGLSAGAMCWFQAGLSMSGGALEPVPGLGLLRGSLSVHMDSEPQRLQMFCQAVGAKELPPGYAADDGAGLVFDGTRLLECVGSRAGARVVEIRPENLGSVSRRQLPVRLLHGGGDGQLARVEEHGVGELRALRAGRHRWD